MELGVILKVAGTGLFVNIINSALKGKGKNEWTYFVTLAGLLVVITLIVGEVNILLNTVKAMFKF